LQNFRGTFAKIPLYPETPAISRGRIKGKANARGLGVLLWQSLTLGSLPAGCMWNLFLETSESILGSASKDLLQAVTKPHLWKLGRYLSRERYMSGVQHNTVK